MQDNRIWQSIEKMWRRLQLVVVVGQIMLVDDSQLVQLVQGKLTPVETKDNIPRIQMYGFASCPTANSDFVAVAIAGDRNNMVIIADGNSKERKKGLSKGESAMWDSLGKYIYLSANGIVINAEGQSVTINAATEVTINASSKVRLVTPLLEVTGDIVDNCDTQPDSMQSMRTTYNTHDHDGIEPGGGTTAIPNQEM